MHLCFNIETPNIFPAKSTRVCPSTRRIHSSPCIVNMDSSSDFWIKEPLKMVQNIFEKSRDGNWENEVASYFKEKLESNPDLYQIPSLNCCPMQHLPANTLVRYRGMIQDMFDPEFYINSYEAVDKNTKKNVHLCGRYKDVMDVAAYEGDIQSSQNNMRERYIYHCIPIPVETSWVKEIYAGKCCHNNQPSSSASNQRIGKRSSDFDNENQGEAIDSAQTEDAMVVETSSELSEAQTKKLRPEKEQTTEMENVTLNKQEYGLGEVQTGACIVKVYDDSESFSLNDCYEFIGMLSVDPSLAYVNEPTEGVQSAFGDRMDMDEENARSPPASLVPRLHVIHTQKLFHNNPLLPVECNASLNIISEAVAIKNHLKAILQMALGDDGLAAEYVLCHLISSVYVRKEDVTIGKFCVNVSNVQQADHALCFYKLIEKLTTKSHYLPMSLTNMNSSTFVPKKDYTKNILVGGTLQLSPQTHLVVDETVMTSGKLDTKGVQNLTALGNLISWQKVSYDFNFHQLEYPTNIAVIVLSEGKSILPSDCHVPIQQNTSESLESLFNAIQQYLTPSLLDDIRRYIGALKLVDFTMSDDLQQAVQEDFVAARRNETESMTAEDLHLLLVLARLLSISEGKLSLTMENWEKAKWMEKERKDRLERP